MTDSVPPASGSDVPSDRLLSVAMDDWAVLGGPVRLDIGEERTVLVGRNAAGKSVLLESILTGALAALHNPRISTLGPGHMCFKFRVGNHRIAYSYQRTFNQPTEVGDDFGVTWEERCEHADSKTEIWTVGDGVAHLPGGRQMPMPPENGLLRLKETPALQLPPEVSKVRRLVRGIHLVCAGVPREGMFREPLMLSKYRPDARNEAAAWGKNERVSRTMALLVSWFESRKDLFDAVVAIGRRLEVLRDITIMVHEEKAPPDKPQLPTHTARLFVDETDFGYLSDGTLRVIEIVTNLVDPNTTVLLLEEPETAIHPGLLRRVLAEIDAFALDRQVVISTHSPIIVDWARPKDVRMVERNGGKTDVHAFTPRDQQDVVAYLNDNLSLSDFVYSRSSE